MIVDAGSLTNLRPGGRTPHSPALVFLLPIVRVLLVDSMERLEKEISGESVLSDNANLSLVILLLASGSSINQSQVLNPNGGRELL